MQNDKITIRKARISDVPIIVELFDKFMEEHKKIVLQRNSRQEQHVKRKNNSRNIFKSFIEKNITSSKSIVNVAHVNGKIAGYALSYIKDGPAVYKVDKVGYISDLYVIKDFRGKGIATRFKNEAFRFFRKKGIRFKSIMANPENKHARYIYKKWGFFDFHIEMRKD